MGEIPCIVPGKFPGNNFMVYRLSHSVNPTGKQMTSSMICSNCLAINIQVDKQWFTQVWLRINHQGAENFTLTWDWGGEHPGNNHLTSVCHASHQGKLLRIYCQIEIVWAINANWLFIKFSYISECSLGEGHDE